MQETVKPTNLWFIIGPRNTMRPKSFSADVKNITVCDRIERLK